jgi:hypothetical protein
VPILGLEVFKAVAEYVSEKLHGISDLKTAHSRKVIEQMSKHVDLNAAKLTTAQSFVSYISSLDDATNETKLYMINLIYKLMNDAPRVVELVSAVDELSRLYEANLNPKHQEDFDPQEIQTAVSVIFHFAASMIYTETTKKLVEDLRDKLIASIKPEHNAPNN